MRRLFVAMLAAACVVGSSSAGFARGGGGHAGGLGHIGGGSMASNPSLLLPTPQMSPAPSAIPAPLASPGLAPTINGPVSQPAFRGLTGMGE
jgi:hypothetical protein